MDGKCFVVDSLKALNKLRGFYNFMNKILYPVLPLRNIVVFPNMVVPLFVGREKSVAALEHVICGDHKELLLVTQRDPHLDSPEPSDLYSVGTIANVLQLLKLPDGTVKVLIEGVYRASINEIIMDGSDFAVASIDAIEENIEFNEELEAVTRTVINEFEQYIKINKKIPHDVLSGITQIDNPSKLADTISSYLDLKMQDKQLLLETSNINARFEKIIYFIESENNITQVERKIRNRIKRQMEKTQKEYYLNEQLKAIHKELGDTDDVKNEVAELEEKIQKIKLSKEARQKANAEIKKLKLMSSTSAEATVIRNYLDWLLDLPWAYKTKTKNDLIESEEILNKGHFGLEKVKERILEYLSVQMRVGRVKGQILCLVGPPGVGKTSLGKSIAHATGRNFTRISLGGMRDESEIKGHRKTYIGSMPGKIIQAIKKAKSSNPLILLDEIDKMGSDWRGDPASALLEVLDPEQNATFNDHYLEVDYDLSNVLFVTTANTLNMPKPLLDRMELIRISGYTEDEKIEIAKIYILPKQLKNNGLKEKEFQIDEDVFKVLIRNYTRESGVRGLEREIANLARKAVRAIVSKKESNIHITVDNLEKYAGISRFKHDEIESQDLIGVATGLAWTEVGGEMLMIEAVVIPGKGNILITGKLGDVMKESVQAAISYIRSKSKKLGIEVDVFEKHDIHLHVPEGATPKDGPSAGITICTAIISAITGKPVKREVAMTGEITLRGRVLSIGGLKEKLLAAHRGGSKVVIIPFDNLKDLEEIPNNIKEGLTIQPVKMVDDVIALAF